MISDKIIEERAKIETDKLDSLPGSWESIYYYRGFIQGFKACEKMMIEEASEGFDEWFQERFHDVEFENEEIYASAKYENLQAWISSKLAAEKKHREEIEEIKKDLVWALSKLRLSGSMVVAKDAVKIERKYFNKETK